MRFVVVIIIFFGACVMQSTAFAQDATSSRERTTKKLTDKQIAKLLIKDSIDSYSGNCPCPYNTTRNGSRCGKRSAYSKPGGAAPLCYEKDVTKELIEAYRETVKLKQ